MTDGILTNGDEPLAELEPGVASPDVLDTNVIGGLVGTSGVVRGARSMVKTALREEEPPAFRFGRGCSGLTRGLRGARGGRG